MKPTYKVTGVFPNHKQKHPQKVIRYVEAYDPDYAKERFNQDTRAGLRLWKPIKVKTVPVGHTPLR